MFKKIASFVLAAGLAITSLTGALPVQAQATYPSELTGLPVSTALQSQRPVAVMVDNDIRSYPHYGVADADIVYEQVNSMANNRITRLMCLYKDWGAAAKLGNIRSTRPTNILTAIEYNAALVHDGGPYYINNYLKSTGIADLDNRYVPYSRVNNGKAVEFTEYALTGDIAKSFTLRGISPAYTANPGSHFTFNPANTDLAAKYPAAVIPANLVNLAGNFPNTASQLVYNAATGTYDYYTFGKPSVDADTNKQVSFQNVILQDVATYQYDANGYLIYNVIGAGVGFYCTNGKCTPISWAKGSEAGKTIYYDVNGAPLSINPGKTYIGLIPQDSAAQTIIQ